MSLYNTLFGRNQLADVLLAVIGLPVEIIPRFRDASIAADGAEIMVFTRTGGGNREDYENENCGLQDHPLYLRDTDSEFDCTYAEFFFRVPDEFKDQIKALAEQGKGTTDPMTQFKELIQKLQAGNKEDPQVIRALEVGQKILAPVIDALKEHPAGPQNQK